MHITHPLKAISYVSAVCSCVRVFACICATFYLREHVVSLRSPFYSKSMMRPVGREILLAQNDFVCQIFRKIATDHCRRHRRDCPKWFRLVNGPAFYDIPLACH